MKSTLALHVPLNWPADTEAVTQAVQLPHLPLRALVQRREKVTCDRVWSDQLRRDPVRGVEVSDRIPVTLVALLGQRPGEVEV